MDKRTKDYTGQRFGRWTVIEYVGGKEKGYNRPAWLCRCDCGTEKIVMATSLRTGSTSCGCYMREVFTKHGMYKTRLHKEWRSIKHRCKNPTASHWEHYGGRGIKICPEWESNFEAFRDWSLAHGYEDGLTIDRIDNDGDYRPDNCRWVTHQENCFNRGVRKDSATGFAGVWIQKNGKYRANIGFNNKSIYLGKHDTLAQAVEARREAEIKYWGFTKIPEGAGASPRFSA